jgi:hypothetical protein
MFVIVNQALADKFFRGKDPIGQQLEVTEGTALTLGGSAVVRHMRTMKQGLEDESYAKPRFGVEIYAVFAMLGLLLVSAGLYGVMSYTVSPKTRDGHSSRVGREAGRRSTLGDRFANAFCRDWHWGWLTRIVSLAALHPESNLERQSIRSGNASQRRWNSNCDRSRCMFCAFDGSNTSRSGTYAAIGINWSGKR